MYQYMPQHMLLERLYCGINETKELEAEKFGMFRFTNLRVTANICIYIIYNIYMRYIIRMQI